MIIYRDDCFMEGAFPIWLTIPPVHISTWNSEKVNTLLPGQFRESQSHEISTEDVSPIQVKWIGKAIPSDKKVLLSIIYLPNKFVKVIIIEGIWFCYVN